MGLTIAGILERPHFSESEVLAGNNGLNRLIKWVHIMEVTEIGQLLNGYELILTTGVGWKENQDLSFSFLQQLIENNASGLCIELGTYTNIIPEKMIKYAEENNFPLIIFKKQVRFVDITHDVNTLLIDVQYKMMSDLERFSNKLNQLLLSTDAFTGIIRLLHNYLNLQVAYFPVEGEAQFVPRIDQSRRETMVKAFQETPLTESKQSIAYKPIEALGHKFADLVVFLNSEGFTEFESLVLDRAATALAQDLLRELYVTEKKKYNERGWVQNWLNGEYHTEAIEQHLSSLAPNFKPNGCVVCFCKSDLLNDETHSTYYSMIIRSICEQQGFFMLSFVEPSAISIILVNKRGADDWKTRVGRIIAKIDETEMAPSQAKSRIDIGIGKWCSILSRLNESYQTAQEAFYMKEKIGTESHLFYEDLHVYRLMPSLSKTGKLEDLISEYLGPVLAYDAKHNGEMLTTLEVLLDANGSKKETAERLFIVRQTLYHRIEKLKELIGDDFMRSEKRLAIELAIYGQKYLKL
ncbi:purine catabolism regulator [Scopulibacillus darangshiensis]|uniref:Purine catabolism regulator n=1 Tax=Scopulibacillus darangshiensis TaxID=442528 RepID=A0A4V2SKS1_9BACL|nr:PucR family transcriptional regulator [Scopulibacillus darangshiensis]TCP20636.1 purine catabolism regulator [Scopulibacillus darangshiensis]